MKKQLLILYMIILSVNTKSTLYQDLGQELLKTCEAPKIQVETEEEIKAKRKELSLVREPLNNYQVTLILSNLLQKFFPLETSTIFNEKVWSDLELLTGTHNLKFSILSQIKRTQTPCGDFLLARILTEPTSSIEVMLQRQQLIQELKTLTMNDKKDGKKLQDSLNIIGKHTPSLLGFFEPETEFNQKTINAYYVSAKNPISRIFTSYNTSPAALECAQVLHRVKNVGKIVALPACAFAVVYKSLPLSYGSDKKGTYGFAYDQNYETYLKDHKDDQKIKELQNEQDTLSELDSKNRRAYCNSQINYDEYYKKGNIINDHYCNLEQQKRNYLEATTDIIKKSKDEGFANALSMLSPIPTQTFDNSNGQLYDKDTLYLYRVKKPSENINLESNNPEDVQKIKDLEIKAIFSAPIANHYSLMLKILLDSQASKSLKREALLTFIPLAYVTGLQSWLTYSAYADEKENNALTNYLHAQLLEVAHVVRAFKDLSIVLTKNPEINNRLIHANDIHALFDKTNTRYSSKMHQLINLLLTNTFTGSPSYFCHKGRVLAAYKLMTEVKDEFALILHATGELDAFNSCAQLMKEYENTDTPYTFAEYRTNQTAPSLMLEEMWNPLVMLNTNARIVKNSINLGPDTRKNALISGPNAGGKSTFMKGLNVAIILGQTLGIVSANKLTFTPFSKIITYMNITDDTASGKSLFMSEVERAQELLDIVEHLDKNQFSLCIMDEMFSGTSPREGEAASYAVAEELGSTPNSILLLASHFDMLKKLEFDTPLFINYQVRVIRYDDGTFTYPFKVEYGAANQNVALEILKSKGVNARILDKAQKILAAA